MLGKDFEPVLVGGVPRFMVALSKLSLPWIWFRSLPNIRGGPRPSVVEQANFIPERLLTLRTRNSAAYKGLYALQMKMGAKDWRTGTDLSPRFTTMNT